ncbi:MAG: hypothetical protein O2931_11970, partial [Planctomycetota bacterium]|nr:hypothetical protein [Planctomycetota bacterium]
LSEPSTGVEGVPAVWSEGRAGDSFGLWWAGCTSGAVCSQETNMKHNAHTTMAATNGATLRLKTQPS